VLATWVGVAAENMDQAQQALAIAHDIGDPALLTRALTACGLNAAGQNAEVAGPYFAEAIGLARELGDRWSLSWILVWQAWGALVAGDLSAMREAGEEGRDLAEAIGDRFDAGQCRVCLGYAQIWQGDLAGAAAQFGELVAEAQAAHDWLLEAHGLSGQGFALAYQGDTVAARAAADAAIQSASELSGIFAGTAYAALAVAAMSAGDVATALDAYDAAWRHLSVQPGNAALQRASNAQAALVAGDLIEARRWADDAVQTTTGWHLMTALITRTRVAMAQGEPEEAERDAHDALTCAAEVEAHMGVPDILDCLATLAGNAGSHREAARLFAAAHAIRQRMGAVRFKIYDAAYEVSVAGLRDALGDQDFDSAWAEGAAMSTEEAIAYAQRGHGERKRPTSGWASLTPAERDVVRLVSEGLTNNDVATRLFVSPRTVQTHLTHVYTKLGVTSRVQLAQEAARHP
jgi:DNA-binding CsgD family transcriptional regulator